ncbi:hypothetical protein M885DRAFT_566230 [Pelagophyceae sp. CCMP2097]|nr:hypothetical protein M885DRAFT_566230 [Pelagophyceae sp. CCMP2097]
MRAQRRRLFSTGWRPKRPKVDATRPRLVFEDDHVLVAFKPAGVALAPAPGVDGVWRNGAPITEWALGAARPSTLAGALPALVALAKTAAFLDVLVSGAAEANCGYAALVCGAPSDCGAPPDERGDEFDTTVAGLEAGLEQRPGLQQHHAVRVTWRRGKRFAAATPSAGRLSRVGLTAAADVGVRDICEALAAAGWPVFGSREYELYERDAEHRDPTGRRIARDLEPWAPPGAFDPTALPFDAPPAAGARVHGGAHLALVSLALPPAVSLRGDGAQWFEIAPPSKLNKTASRVRHVAERLAVAAARGGADDETSGCSESADVDDSGARRPVRPRPAASVRRSQPATEGSGVGTLAECGGTAPIDVDKWGARAAVLEGNPDGAGGAGTGPALKERRARACLWIRGHNDHQPAAPTERL